MIQARINAKPEMVIGAEQITAAMVSGAEALPESVERRDNGALFLNNPIARAPLGEGVWVIYGPFGVAMPCPDAVFLNHYTPLEGDT